MEVKGRKQEIYQIDYKHEECKYDGNYVYKDGCAFLLTDPPLYEHICDKCGMRFNINNRYPRIAYFDCE